MTQTEKHESTESARLNQYLLRQSAGLSVAVVKLPTLYEAIVIEGQ